MKHMKIEADLAPWRAALTPGVIQFALLYLLPVFAITLFIWTIASDRYVSTASAIVTEEKSSAPTVDLSLLSLAGASPTDQVALVVKEFIESQDMLRYLDETLELARSLLPEEDRLLVAFERECILGELPKLFVVVPERDLRH